MAAIDALNTGVQGIQRGIRGLERDANQIARANGDSQSEDQVTSAVVHLAEDREQVAASAKVVEAAGEVLGSLVDVRA